MSKKKSSKPAQTPLYATFPTAEDHVNPKTGKVEPDPESVEFVRDWGKQSKL